MSEFVCPFCNEKDFDGPGLKSHIANFDCEAYNHTEYLDRMFTTAAVSVPVDEYKDLQRNSFFLGCLEEQGVDNWEGYGDAQLAYRKELPDELK